MTKRKEEEHTLGRAKVCRNDLCTDKKYRIEEKK
jgi:hypothetical protein